MTRVFNLNDQLVFITRNNSLLDNNNRILATIENDKIVTDNDILALCGNNQVSDPKGNPLIRIFTDIAYFRGHELCKLEGGDNRERALGAAGFLFFA